jgi:hypothetical protein
VEQNFENQRKAELPKEMRTLHNDLHILYSLFSIIRVIKPRQSNTKIAIHNEGTIMVQESSRSKNLGLPLL